MNTTFEDTLPAVPSHIAIIMDGNRRWARERHLPVLEGHRRVVDAILEPLIEHASARGVKYLTFWAWSTENWQRKADEVSGIMGVFRHVIKKKWQKLHEKGVRIKIIGNIDQFDEDIKSALLDVVDQTQNNTVITTVFALNYGGRDEIIRAIQRMCADKSADPQFQVSNHQFEQYLDTAGVPDPELIIRTGGEQRLSGFLLWQSEYSEFYFPTWYMPDFTPEKLDEVIAEFQRRKRNFGK